MQKKIQTFLGGAIILILLPFVVTLLFQGDTILPGPSERMTTQSETDTQENGFDSEEIEGKVISIVAKEIAVSGEREAIKAQAVIARTNLIAARISGEEEPEGLSADAMMRQFGEDAFERCYRKLSECVEATKGLVLTSGNKVIEAPYFAVSAGHTRNAADAFGKESVSYLKSVESKQDIESEEYLYVEFLDIAGFVADCNAAFPEAGLTAEGINDQIEVLTRDEAEYVREIRLGAKTVGGEEFRKALKLRSACFTIKEVEGKLRIVTKGVGHGVGLSQYGAEYLAAQGHTYEEILKTYFSEIKITEYKKTE